jgi:hypothetical protein
MCGLAAPAAQEGAAVKTDGAIDRGVAYLVSRQDKGGWINDRATNLTTMTSLAILAMAAVGHQPTDETKEGVAMRRALDYVLHPDRQDPAGYFGGMDGSRMYGHGMITLMLAEMLGMGVDTKQDQRIRDRLRRAVDLVLRAQSVRKEPQDRGGWRYDPASTDSDLSVTVWQVMALRSARNAGIEVPKEAIDLALGYVKRCHGGRGDKKVAKAACGYVPGQTARFAMASAGLLALQVGGDYECPEVASSVEWLKEHKLKPHEEYFFYGTYYYSQGMYQRGGEAAALARKNVEEALLALQQADGSWQGPHSREKDSGKVYTTSLALLSLAVKHHFLPIYQR